MYIPNNFLSLKKNWVIKKKKKCVPVILDLSKFSEKYSHNVQALIVIITLLSKGHGLRPIQTL